LSAELYRIEPVRRAPRISLAKNTAKQPRMTVSKTIRMISTLLAKSITHERLTKKVSLPALFS